MPVDLQASPEEHHVKPLLQTQTHQPWRSQLTLWAPNKPPEGGPARILRRIVHRLHALPITKGSLTAGGCLAG